MPGSNFTTFDSTSISEDSMDTARDTANKWLKIFDGEDNSFTYADVQAIWHAATWYLCYSQDNVSADIVRDRMKKALQSMPDFGE